MAEFAFEVSSSNAYSTSYMAYCTADCGGDWPDWGPPHWTQSFNGQTVAAQFERHVHHPFPLARIEEDGAGWGVATTTVRIGPTAVPLATRAEPGAPLAYTAYLCGPRPERLPHIEGGFDVVTDTNGNVVATHQARPTGCPAGAGHAMMAAVLVAPVGGVTCRTLQVPLATTTPGRAASADVTTHSADSESLVAGLRAAALLGAIGTLALCCLGYALARRQRRISPHAASVCTEKRQ